MPLTRENYRRVLEPLVGVGDFILNLSVDVSSTAIVAFAHERGALYLDTVVEPWGGVYFDRSLSPAARSNYALREEHAEAAPRARPRPDRGQRPGRQPRPGLAAGQGGGADRRPRHRPAACRAHRPAPAGRACSATSASRRSTSPSATPRSRRSAKRPGEFVNTWSIDGFVSEGCQPAELGWGTHERHFPKGGMRHANGCGAAIYLNQPGAGTRVRTWTPNYGPFHGFLVTHNESISIADYLTLRDGDAVLYRPTVHYAYHPCDAAVLSVHELAGRGWQQQAEQRLLMEEIVTGMDELGVLLMGHKKGAFWYGSQLTIERGAASWRRYNSATSLQVAAGVLGGMVCAIEQPTAGIVEADELDYRRVLEVARPYLGPVVGAYSDWTPLDHRAGPVPRGHRPGRPLAVQEHPGRLTPSSSVSR